RLLVEEVASQLELALENAQLYAEVQQELGERVRAEQEVNRRNQELSALNQMSQQMSKLASHEEIYNEIAAMLGQVFEFDRLTVATFDAKTDSLSFPAVVEPQGEIAGSSRALAKNLTLWLVHAGESVLVDKDVKTYLTARSIEVPGIEPKSLLAVPMSTGEAVIGTIVLENYRQTTNYTSTHLDLLSTVATQVAIALENASLFEEIRTALEAIENRERYQANVARSVAILTEYGTRSMGDMLSALADAALPGRIYFAQIKEEEHSQYWRSIAEWNKDGPSMRPEKSKTQHMAVALFPNWSAALKDKGWISIVASRAAEPEKDFLSSQGIKSTLLLAVTGKASIP
ncbi:GAF domain-containing protein, partial [bacterium]